MKQYKLSDDYVLRADPHLEKYALFNYKTGEIVHLAEYDNLLLNILSNGPVNISDLAKFICKEYPEFSATPEYVGKTIDFFVKKGLVKPLHAKSAQSNLDKIILSESGVSSSGFQTKTSTFSFPLEVDLFLTRQCNMRCVHCSVDAGESFNSELSLEYWKDIFDQLENSRLIKVIITGGEPTLFPGFLELIDYIKDKKIYKCLLTNGISLTESTVCLLKKADIVLGISIDGADDKTHDSFRRTAGAFKKVMGSFDKLNRYSVKFDILSVIHQKNFHQIEGLFQIARKYQAIGLILNVIESVGRGKKAKKWMLSHDEMDHARKEFYRLQPLFPEIHSSFKEPQQYLGKDSADNCNIEKNECISCRGGNSYMAIDTDGTVYPCPYGVFIGKMPIGNSRLQALSEIWNSENWHMFRGGTTIDQLKACSICPEKNRCELKNCRMRSMVQGDPYARPYNCPLA